MCCGCPAKSRSDVKEVLGGQGAGGARKCGEGQSGALGVRGGSFRWGQVGGDQCRLKKRRVKVARSRARPASFRLGREHFIVVHWSGPRRPLGSSCRQ